MHLSTSLLSTIAVAAPLASATPTLFARDDQCVGTVDHDKAQPFAEHSQSGKAGELILRYKPFLYTYNGCVPFPAVQQDGSVNGGLNDSGGMSDGCSSSKGQVYARARDYGDQYAIMYSWYFPKDQGADGDIVGGHRHDWENVVVWLTGKANPEVKGISYSMHGDYTKVKAKVEGEWDGDRPLVIYKTVPGNHHLERTDEKGGQQPLISWDAGDIFKAAKRSLNCYNFGDANVPMNEAHFEPNLNKAML